MSDDILSRLRSTGGLDARLLCEAADEIQRLREQLTSLKFMRIREVGTLQDRLHELSGDAGKLREERDDARREICLLRSSSTNATEKISAEMKEYARSRGWECFEEVKP